MVEPIKKKATDKRPLVFHPFFFALFPVLSLFSHNVWQASFKQILQPAGFILGITILLLLLFRLLEKDWQKAGTTVTFVLMAIFLYRPFYVVMQHLPIIRLIARHKYLLCLWGLLFILAFYFTLRTSKPLCIFTKFLNIVGLCLVIIPLAQVSLYKCRVYYLNKKTGNNPKPKQSEFYTPTKPSQLPDIYYIILDRYADINTLENVYNFDNRSFYAFLRHKGFYVATHSHSNYLRTPHSLASSLNIGYINYLTNELSAKTSDFIPMFKMIEDNVVCHILKNMGYKFIHFGSWWEPTRKNKNADLNINFFSISEFSKRLYEGTIFEILHFLDFRRIQWKRVLYKFDKLAEIPKIEEPTFVFAHFLFPHRPYVFDRAGNFMTTKERARKGKRKSYVDQLIFTNKKVKYLIDKLLADSKVPPVIILQADEGPFPESIQNSKTFNWTKATKAEIREKMGILNAYYLPNVDEHGLYSSITPVNSFRLVFNLYFKANYLLLPDRIYIFESYKRPYIFHDVSDIVNYK